MAVIRNPVEWGLDTLKSAARHSAGMAQAFADGETQSLPTINRIGIADIGDALHKGIDDFRACRTDVLVLMAIYPLAGFVLWWTVANYHMLPLLFPIASGFALVGPVAAVGLYEMSRQRESGKTVNWASAFDVVRSPAFGSIIVLGLGLIAIFLVWLGAAQVIYTAFLGPQPPDSFAAFFTQVLTTPAGWAMALMGIAAGFLFAVLVLTISAVSFPMLLDRHVGVSAAVVTSVRSVLANPVPMALWGLIVAGGLVAASIPLFLGLIVVVPVLGHATWHLYRKLVARE